MWPFRILILAFTISLSKNAAADSLSPLSELENGGVRWALLVAGSNGWKNYRHQADVCQAYHILHKNGIPAERIVVMMYDDIAYNKQNPQKGVVINENNGINVYKCVPKDYTRSAVTADVFLKVLQGEKAEMTKLGSGKVINSGPNDSIFVYYSDHGSNGLLYFLDYKFRESNFISTLNKMYKDKKYAKMLIYIESCFSGSIFTKLPKDTNVFAMTASRAYEQSHACATNVYLTTSSCDVFSRVWMDMSQKVSLKRTTVRELYDMVKNQVNKSHVESFGDMSIGNMYLSDFLGSNSDLQNLAVNNAVPDTIFDFSNSISSFDVPLDIMIKKWKKASRRQEKEDIELNLSEYFKERNLINNVFRDIVEDTTQKKELIENSLNTEEIINTECYEEAVDHFYKACSHYTHNEYILEHLYSFVRLCNENYQIGLITVSINRGCSLRNSTVSDWKMFSNSVNSRNVTLDNLISNWEEARSQQEKEDIKRNFSEYFKEGDLINQIFHDIAEKVIQKNEQVENLLSNSEEITNTKCYEEAVDHFLRACSPYRHSVHMSEHFKRFGSLCNEKLHITDAISSVCSHYTQLYPDEERGTDKDG